MVTATQTLIVEWSFCSTALVFLLLRLYLRFSQRQHLLLSDYFLITAWIAYCISEVCDTELARLGLFEDGITYQNDLSKLTPSRDKNIQILKLAWGSSLPYYVVLWCVKGSLLLFYATLIPKTSKRYRFTLYGVSIFVVITFFLVILSNAFWCLPVSRNWAVGGDYCYSFSKYTVFFMAVVCNILTDLMIFLLPFPLLVHLRVPRAQLYGLIFIFSLGFLCIFATIARVIAISKITTTKQIAVWSSAELATGMMVACSPTLRVLLRRSNARRSKNNTPPSPETGNNPARRPHYTGQSWKDGPLDESPSSSPNGSPSSDQRPWFRRPRSLSRSRRMRPEDSGWKPPSRAEQRELNALGASMKSMNNDRDIFISTMTNISVEPTEVERGRRLSPIYSAEAHGGHTWTPEADEKKERDLEAQIERKQSRSRSRTDMLRISGLRSLSVSRGPRE